ncbi:MAG: phage portal protein [Pseudonocardiaceae bacterium]
MPLPVADSQWPPAVWRDVYGKYREWGAWYSGDYGQLSSVYGGAAYQTQGYVDQSGVVSRYQFTGGVMGSIARFFWGTPPSKNTYNSAKLHIPTAEEIASEGAYQLFNNPPKIYTPSKIHQARIDYYVEQGLFIQLMHAAELSCALSGVFIRGTYDFSVSDIPILSVVSPDCALPTFYFDRLRGAILWRVISEEKSKVVRHLESHDPGIIEHGVYVGDYQHLGKRVPLSQYPETANLDNEAPSMVGSLDVIYVPNLWTRIWRDKGMASSLGRSDYGSVTSVMDALDEAYTSWMRDIRLGKARILVPQQYLDSGGRGKGATFDLDRDVFVSLNVMAAKDKLEITPSQFDIRYEEHANTCSALLERILSGSGYSEQTFGLTGEVAMTATEANARERRTFVTRAAKIEIWRRKVADLIRIMLGIDTTLGIVPPLTEEINVQFPPPVQEGRKVLAEISQLLSNAKAASRKTLVALNNPTWDTEQVMAEVAEIERMVPLDDIPELPAA